ncbi:hypothetical protein OPV22_001033 [Ensete ventricosum]|uniref:Uncharacterized protein n=1 Tax=Ensete ventricosum TaxID=4639 RepID=A0AAV8RV60_ENSVE|nr:hypothetical protein OPV22_001033 [Ensete ventricosum]
MAQEAEAIENKRKAGNDFVGDGSCGGDGAEGDLPATSEAPAFGVDPESLAEAPGSYPDLVDVYIACLSDGRYGDSKHRFGYKHTVVAGEALPPTGFQSQNLTCKMIQEMEPMVAVCQRYLRPLPYSVPQIAKRGTLPFQLYHENQLVCMRVDNIDRLLHSSIHLCLSQIKLAVPFFSLIAYVFIRWKKKPKLTTFSGNSPTMSVCNLSNKRYFQKNTLTLLYPSHQSPPMLSSKV